MNKVEDGYLIVLLILLFLLIIPFSSAAEDDSDIVEKNLFSPEREKWIMEPPVKKKTASKGKKGKVDNIILSGTIVSDRLKSAVLALSTKRKPGKSSIYMEGDYMSGYLLKEISERNVVLQDVQSGEDYVIFLNDEKKNRTAVKTEIKDISKQVSSDRASERSKKDLKKGKKLVSRPAETDSILKDRLNQSFDILERKKSSLVLKQTENDMKKLKKILPQMSAKDKKEFRVMKKRFSDLKKKNK